MLGRGAHGAQVHHCGAGGKRARGAAVLPSHLHLLCNGRWSMP